MIEAAFSNIPIISSDCKKWSNRVSYEFGGGLLINNNDINSLKIQFSKI